MIYNNRDEIIKKVYFTEDLERYTFDSSLIDVFPIVIEYDGVLFNNINDLIEQVKLVFLLDGDKKLYVMKDDLTYKVETRTQLKNKDFTNIVQDPQTNTYKLYKYDSNGDKIPVMIQKLDEDGNPIPIMQYKLDADGNKIQAKDTDGNLVFEKDADGNYIYDNQDPPQKIPVWEQEQSTNPDGTLAFEMEQKTDADGLVWETEDLSFTTTFVEYDDTLPLAKEQKIDEMYYYYEDCRTLKMVTHLNGSIQLLQKILSYSLTNLDRKFYEKFILDVQIQPIVGQEVFIAWVQKDSQVIKIHHNSNAKNDWISAEEIKQTLIQNGFIDVKLPVFNIEINNICKNKIVDINGNNIRLLEAEINALTSVNDINNFKYKFADRVDGLGLWHIMNDATVYATNKIQDTDLTPEQIIASGLPLDTLVCNDYDWYFAFFGREKNGEIIPDNNTINLTDQNINKIA